MEIKFRLSAERGQSGAGAQNKISRGLLTICCYCKKTRNSEGCWEQVEAYVTNTSQVELTHGICPECMAVVEDEIKAFMKDGLC